jgi:CheY-like chemotaxis protein/HPt (histidine-containing phosphotransfer) domain-containing protein
VLVVEDHPVNQQVARRQLERLGCSVVVAENGALGVAIAKAERFDLILMDVQMPILDGLSATREIRAAEAADTRTPIIGATASAMTDEIERCREAGMDDLLVKPIDRAGLQSMLARYLPARPLQARPSQARPWQAPPPQPPPPQTGDALAGSDPVLDQARLAALIEEDRAFAATLAATFIDSAREMLRAIEAATVEPNRVMLSALSHKLQGAARSAGADELARLARRLELEVPGGCPESLGALNRNLQRAYADTVASLGRLGLGERVA